MDLSFLAPGRSLFTQLVATIRGLVEIETQKVLQKQEENDRRLERTIQAWGIGLGSGAIVASSSGHIDKKVQQFFGMENCHPFAATLLLSASVGIVFGKITWLYTLYTQKKSDRPKIPGKK